MKHPHTESERRQMDVMRQYSSIINNHDKIPQTPQSNSTAPDNAHDTGINLHDGHHRDLEHTLDAIKQRLSRIEHVLNVRSYTKIESSIKKHLSKILIIKKVYIKSIQSGFLLTIIHNTEPISKAIELARPGLIDLEDEFPGVQFDTWFLRLSDVHDEHLLQSALVFLRKND